MPKPTTIPLNQARHLIAPRYPWIVAMPMVLHEGYVTAHGWDVKKYSEHLSNCDQITPAGIGTVGIGSHDEAVHSRGVDS